MKLAEEILVEKNTGKAFVVHRGELIRLYGRSVIDFVSFNADELTERFCQAKTKSMQRKIYLSTGDRLISRKGNVMFTIVNDTYSCTHDLQLGMCSRVTIEYNRKLSPEEYLKRCAYPKPEVLPDHGCYENLDNALSQWGIKPEDIPNPFSIFETLKINADTGEITFTNIRPAEGTFIELRAEMNCLAGVSACPMRGYGEEVTIQVYRE